MASGVSSLGSTRVAMSGNRVGEELQATFVERVRANRIAIDGRWGQTCLGFIVQLPLPAAVADVLARVQALASAGEAAALHLTPTVAMHVSIASLLGVREAYGRAKVELWDEMRAACYSELSAIAAETRPFTVTFRGLVATDAAVIAVAEDDAGQMAALRRRIADRLPIPPESGGPIGIVHSTVCRYRTALRDPTALLERISAIDLQVEMRIGALLVVRELAYPSLTAAVEAAFPLAGRSA